jgi:autotransporter adhesin
MAALRLAHRALGMKRDRLGLGTLGVGGAVGALLAAIGVMTPQTAFAQVAIGNGVVSNPANCTNPSAATAGSTAIGCGANAAGASSTAIGSGTVANGQNALAIGDSNSATGDGSIIVGYANSVNGLNAIGMGVFANATGLNALAIGGNAHATGNGASAFGVNTTANGAAATAIGNGSSATGTGAMAMGLGAAASSPNGAAMALGSGAKANAGTGGGSPIAIGVNANASGTAPAGFTFEAVALGTGSSATGSWSTSVGPDSSATGTGASAFGTSAKATANQATAVGNGASASAVGTAAMGYLANASGVSASAFGIQAVASGTSSLAAGNLARASGNFGVALGNQAQALGSAGAVAMGSGAIVASAATGGVALGNNAASNGAYSVAAGTGTNASGINSIAIGSGNASVQGAQASANNAIAVGFQSVASAASAIAVGNSAVANSANAIAMGTNALATGGQAVSIGAGNVANGNGAVAIGDPSTATGNGAIASGLNNTATGDGTVAMGNTNLVGGGGQGVGTPGNAAQGAVGIGYQNTVIGQGSVALGNSSRALAAGSLAFGDTATASNAGDVALGSGSVTAAAVPTPSTVIGGTTYNFAGINPTSTVSVGSATVQRTITNVAAGRISGASTDAINGSQLFATNQQVTQNTTDISNLSTTINDINTGGGIKYFHANSTLPDSQALGTDSVAIGPNAIANNAGDVAIGLNAVSGPTTAVGSTVIGGVTYTFAGGTPTGGAFSVGRAGAERQIQNVAAGRLSGTSTDAVNGSQLFATNSQVTQNTTDIANLDSSLTNIGDTINNIAGDTSTAYTDANGDGIRYVRTNDRTLPVTDSFAQGIASTAVGYQATASADDSLALGRDSQAIIVGGVALGSDSVSDRPIAPASGSVIVGTGLVPYNTTDKNLLGAISVGNSTSYRQITNLADGTEDQDAVSLRQLKGALSSFAVSGTKYFHANSTASDSAAVGLESVAIGPRTTVNGNNGIGMGNGAIVQMTAPGGIAIGQNSTVNLADGIALGTNSTANGIQATAIGPGATANEPGSVALGAGSTTAAAVATSGTTIKGVNYTFAGTNPTSTVSVGSVGNERTITNVAAGRISATSTDAINGSQLHATNQAIENLETGVGDLNEFAVQYNKNVDGSKSNSISLVGGDVNAPVVIHNVAAGTADTDAVNVKQLQDGLTDSRSYTDQMAGTTLQTANAYTDSKLSQLNMDLDGIRSEARQAAAVGLAAASLRYDDRPGKLSVAVGGGYWRSEGSFAFGAGYTSEDGRVRANVSGATADGGWGVGAGVSLTLN